MIGRVSGKLIARHPPQVIVDVHGIGYEIDVPMSTFYNLPAPGERVTLLTHFVVREDAQILYGFGSAAEREALACAVFPAAAKAVKSGVSASIMRGLNAGFASLRSRRWSSPSRLIIISGHHDASGPVVMPLSSGQRREP